METIRIEILNKRAKKALNELADLNLIAIQDKNPLKAFQALLNKLRTKKNPPSLQAITKEVELVRAKRHGKKG
jgi:hypothetical protein